MSIAAKRHWEDVYTRRDRTEVSWFEPSPEVSLAMIETAGLEPSDPIVDLGGGAATLAAELVRRGHTDVTVADISAAALAQARAASGELAGRIRFIEADLTATELERRYRLCHDRALLHFMVDAEDRDAYVRAVRLALVPGGDLVVACFAPDGPERCSGLPVRRYSAEELASLFGEGFELADSRRVTHHTPSGSEQRFVYARLRSTGSPASRQA